MSAIPWQIQHHLQLSNRMACQRRWRDDNGVVHITEVMLAGWGYDRLSLCRSYRVNSVSVARASMLERLLMLEDIVSCIGCLAL